jgi:hypothetical protein
MRNFLVAVAVIGIGGYFGTKLYIQHKAAQDLDAILAQARPVVDIEYEHVVATWKGELRVEGLTVRMAKFDDPFTIESVGVRTPSFLFLLGFDRRGELELPESLGVEVTGMRASIDADFMRELDDYSPTQTRAVEPTPADRCIGAHGLTPVSLKQLGYHELVVDFHASFRREADRLVVELGAYVDNAYEFDLELTLGGVTDPRALASGARPLLVGGRLDYVDHSLNGRIMKYCNEQQVASDEVFAAQLRELHALAHEYGAELDAMITDPYMEFLRGKQRFTLTSAPFRPIDLTQVSLYKPSDVPNLLNLVAEAG